MKIQINKDNFLVSLPKISEAIQDGREYDLSVEVHRNPRSLDANAYLWVLCTKLSKVLRISKEEVYRKHIKAVGVCDFLAVPDKAYDRLAENWSKKGIGWFTEIVDSCKLPNCTKVCLYYGSSTYNTEEMSRLLSNVVDDCKEQGIQTEPQENIDRMVEEWGC